MKRIPVVLPDLISKMGASRRLNRETNKTALVLVVEDDELVCALVREILVSEGYVVLTAYNGTEALDIVTAYCGPMDLLLTDIVLPRIGGKQLVESALALRPGLKALYMSGYPEDALKSFGWPSLPYIQKPFTTEHLVKRVREVLSVGPGEMDSLAVLKRPLIDSYRIDALPDCTKQKGGRL